MDIKKLTPRFYQENQHLKEVLDKNRGYGLTIVSFNGLRFGIPIRTNIHKGNNYCFRTIENGGLDYQKAVLLIDDEYISPVTFMVKQEEYEKINEHEHFINIHFEKYVKLYIKAHIKNDQRVINREFKYSTLMNYHAQLGL